MPIQNNFPSIGFELLPNIWRANITWECLAVIQNLWRENYFEWAFMNGPKSGLEGTTRLHKEKLSQTKQRQAGKIIFKLVPTSTCMITFQKKVCTIVLFKSQHGNADSDIKVQSIPYPCFIKAVKYLPLFTSVISLKE